MILRIYANMFLQNGVHLFINNPYGLKQNSFEHILTIFRYKDKAIQNAIITNNTE